MSSKELSRKSSVLGCWKPEASSHLCEQKVRRGRHDKQRKVQGGRGKATSGTRDANALRATRGRRFGMGREIQTEDSRGPGGQKGSLGAHGAVESQAAATQGEEKPAV